MKLLILRVIYLILLAAVAASGSWVAAFAALVAGLMASHKWMEEAGSFWAEPTNANIAFALGELAVLVVGFVVSPVQTGAVVIGEALYGAFVALRKGAL
jgi:K+-sensing histidine kinase KdpD